jgi:rhamnogalacturonan endolyase
MKLTTRSSGLFIFAILLTLAYSARAQSRMEFLGQGVVAVRTSSTQVYVGWRLVGTDPSSIAFNLYRSGNGGSAVRLNGSPITATTNFIDASANLTQSNAYFVRPVIGGVEQAPSASFTLPANAPIRQFLTVPLQIPSGGTTPDGVNYTYSANDCSVGDLDGDGEYEIVVKWDPSNSHDNSQSGYTGNVFLDAYKLSGTRMWRINLGRNIRAGAHYTQFIVYDLDSDGKAEVACKTADATISGTGQVIGNANADWRNTSGYILSGPEFLTVFNGQTGAILATTNYVPARGNVGDWGDTYGNRVDRFVAGVAYLDGQRPSLIVCRGYYTRTVIVAWDWRNGQLAQRWRFDTRSDSNPGSPAAGFASWEGQGNHQLSIADVDGDGRDEVCYGAITIGDNGVGMYTTTLGHGDAYHVSDMDPDRPGLEIYGPHECPSCYGAFGSEMHDARTGSILWGASGEGADVGRGVAADIDPRFRGYEAWASRGGLYTCKGVQITTSKPSMNFLVWWDADPLRELLDSNHIDKWDYNNSAMTRLLTASECSSNNGSKSTPALSADILGDWREEVIWKTSDSSALHIYTTTIPAGNRVYTLMHDRQYREAIAWQNIGYNQPPHPSFYFGDGMAAPPVPNIVLVRGAGPYPSESAVFGGGAVVESTNGGFIGTGYVNFSLSGGFLEFRNLDGGSGGSRTLRFRFALGAASSRTGNLIVNGVTQSITFNPTGAWTNWSNKDVIVTLNPGATNTVRLESIGQDLANIDELQLP